MDILQAINCDWKIISLIASENTTDGDIPSSTEKGLSLLKHLSRPRVLNIWKQTELLLTCMIQTLEQKDICLILLALLVAKQHRSCLCCTGRKRNYLLIRKLVLCQKTTLDYYVQPSVYHRTSNFPWISCDELSLTKEKLPKVTHSWFV